MSARLQTLLLALTAAACSSACSPKADDRPAANQDSGAAVVAESASAEVGETETDPGETGEADEADDDSLVIPSAEVIEIDAPTAARNGKTVPVKPIELGEASVVWREVAKISASGFEFVPVASGVVARSKSGNYELDDNGELLANPSLKLPNSPLLGHWPDDVWYVDATPTEPGADSDSDSDSGSAQFEYELFRLGRDRSWAAQRHKGGTRWTGEAFAVRKGWRAGVLVRDGSTLTRIGSRASAPKIGVRMGKIILATIETSSGRLYSISERPNGIYVQQACFNVACVNDNAKQLPFGSAWSFSTQIPRHRNSFSMLATVNDRGVESQQLLHFETGGWKLETLVHAPSGMWASAEGGLWLTVGANLRYRTPKGQWYAITPPPGAGKLSAAVSSDLGELWIATKIGSETVVFATSANVEVPE